MSVRRRIAGVRHKVRKAIARGNRVHIALQAAHRDAGRPQCHHISGVLAFRGIGLARVGGIRQVHNDHGVPCLFIYHARNGHPKSPLEALYCAGELGAEHAVQTFDGGYLIVEKADIRKKKLHKARHIAVYALFQLIAGVAEHAECLHGAVYCAQGGEAA